MACPDLSSLPPFDVIIPARAGSTRFPNKPLARLAGRSILQRVWANACVVPGVRRVVVASDDDAILAHARGFGADTVAVRGPCRNGTERVAAAVRALGESAEVVVNLQGDAPLVPPWAVTAALQALARHPEVGMATARVPLWGQDYADYVARKEGGRSSGTTVVCRQDGLALYFTKAVVPKVRTPAQGVAPAHQHVGLYAFRRAALATYAGLAPTPLEAQEELEQLRWLEHGHALQVAEVDLRGRRLWSIDHPEDLAVAEGILATQGELT